MIATALQNANLMARLGLELVALASLASWGWQARPAGLSRLAVAIGAPLIAATAWAMFASPQAHFTAGPSKFVVQVLVLGAAAAAFWVRGRATWAGAFVAIAVVNGALMKLWQQ